MDDIQYKGEPIQAPEAFSPLEIWSTFQKAPINRWAFRNIDKFTAHDVIPPANTQSELPYNTRQFEQSLFSDSEGNTVSFSQAFRFLHTDSFILLKDGHIIYEAYFDGMRPDTPHLLYSAGKPFTASLIYTIIDTGIIHGEDDLIADYLPELKNSAFFDVSIRHLLDMQSGVDIREIDNAGNLERAVGFAPPIDKGGILSIARRLRRKKFPAGAKTDYNSLNTDVLSLLVTRLTGSPAAEFLSSNLFEKMGAEFHSFAIKDPQGINELGGGLAVCTRDLARYALFLLNRGDTHDQQNLPGGSFVNSLYSTAERKKWKQGWLAGLTPQAKAYRSHLYICNDNYDESAIFACGNFGNAIYLNPKWNSAAVILCSYPTGVDIVRFNTLLDLLKAATNYPI